MKAAMGILMVVAIGMLMEGETCDSIVQGVRFCNKERINVAKCP